MKLAPKWWNDKTTLIAVLATVLITFITFLPSLNNGFTNWDDPDYVTENPFITSFSGENMKMMMTKDLASNYHPLTMLSLAANYKMSSFDETGNLTAGAFHWTNLLLHLINVVLVFWFIFLLNGGKMEWALLVAFFFGIHPMHVESVAWISERKDVLYALFFMAGLITYLRHLKEKIEPKYLIYTFIWFLLSCFSKPTAVMFPVVLVLLDYYHGRKWDDKAIIEKVPFFIASIIFGIITIKIQSGEAVGDADQYTIIERIMFVSYGIVAYIGKMFIPVNLSTFYPYPDMDNLPLIFKVAPLLVLGLLALTYFSLKKTKVVVFGLFFFLVINALTLQFVTVGRAVISDRYTYVPYIGLFFILGYLLDLLLTSSKPSLQSLKKAAPFVVGALGLGYAFVAFQQTHVWRNSDTLWTNTKNIFPEDATAYNNLGNYYNKPHEVEVKGSGGLFGKTYKLVDKDVPKALEHLNKSIELDPLLYDAYISRGKLHRENKRLEEAMADYTEAMKLKQTASVFNNRGNVYFSMGRYDEALKDYDEVIKRDPRDAKAYGNMGAVYAQRKQFDQALKQLNKAISINPNYADAYLNRGVICSQTGRSADAVSNYNNYLKFKPNASNVYFWRGQDQVKLGKAQAALTDFDRAIKLSPNNPQYYAGRATAHQALGNGQAAAADQTKAQQLRGK